MWRRNGLITPGHYIPLPPGSGEPGGLVACCPEWRAFRRELRPAASEPWHSVPSLGLRERFRVPVIPTPSEQRRVGRELGGRALLDTHHGPGHVLFVCSCRQKCGPAKRGSSSGSSETSNLLKMTLEQPCGTEWRVSSTEPPWLAGGSLPSRGSEKAFPGGGAVEPPARSPAHGWLMAFPGAWSWAASCRHPPSSAWASDEAGGGN